MVYVDGVSGGGGLRWEGLVQVGWPVDFGAWWRGLSPVIIIIFSMYSFDFRACFVFISCFLMYFRKKQNTKKEKVILMITYFLYNPLYRFSNKI